MCSGGPTGVTGDGPPHPHMWFWGRWWRLRWKVQRGWFDGLGVRYWPRYLIHRAVIAAVGASWVTRCGHVTGRTRGAVPCARWCETCRACHLTDRRLAGKWKTHWL